jgi:hypothetical protein
MASDHDTRVSMSPQPPQDGRWATFVPVSYKNMTLGDPQLDEERWKAYVNGGLVFAAARVTKLWSAEKFLFSHIENKLMFQESQPYHSQKLKFGMNFEIYLQAFV